MTGSETKAVNVTSQPPSSPPPSVDLSRLDIQAMTARAAQLRSAEAARLLRQAWLTVSSLWRGPRHALSPAAKRREVAGTTA
ncbi:MAG: hypothetical protein MUE49_10795 [Rhodospirillales bacterium]|jgi:hypothetical protein|nr:hypothetical protein [Rhodospirillales bacterium]